MRHTYRLFSLFLFALLGLSSVAEAQQENTLFFMGSTPQSIIYNPAKTVDYKVGISLPGLSGGYFGLSNDGFAPRDAVTIENNIATLSLTRLADNLSDRNRISMGLNTDWLGVYLNFDKLALNFRVGERVYAQFEYPKELVGLIVKGNGHPDFLGKQIVIDPKFSALHYREFSLGGSYALLDGKLRVGANLKYLQGVAYVEDQSPEIRLINETSGSYPLTITGSGGFLTAGGASEIANQNEDAYLDASSNGGFSIDLGATYQVNDQIKLELSVLNSGSMINWKDRVETYRFNAENASYSFSGIDAINVFKEDNADQVYDNNVDSLEAVFTLDNGGVGLPAADFTTSLPTLIQLGGQYKLGSGLSIHALASASTFNELSTSTLTLAGVKEFGRWASLALSYTKARNSNFNMGLGFSLNTPVQIHFVSDNLISGLISPENAKYISGRVGINLLFGRKKDAAEPIEEIKDATGL